MRLIPASLATLVLAVVLAVVLIACAPAAKVAGILGACSLEFLSESEAGYDCAARRFSLPVSR